MSTPRSEVARRDEVKVSLLQPLDDLDQALRLSDALSRSELVPDNLRGKASSVLHVILTGQALGLHWTEALRVIYSPGHGQIGMRAQFLLSQLRKAGHAYSAEYSADGEACTFTLIRKDEPDNPYTATFSRQDAVEAKLVHKDNWSRYFKRMLRARAITDCVGFGAPEVLLGFVVEGDEPPPPQVQLQPQSPAPPEPDAGQAAAGNGQAEQAARLRALDEHTKLSEEIEHSRLSEELDRPEGGTSGEIARPRASKIARPEMGEDEDFTLTPGQEAALQPLLAARTTVADATVQPQEDMSLADRAMQTEVAKAFTSVNWPPGRYKADVLRACSTFCRRPITAAKEMKTSEATRLIAELARVRSQDSEAAPEARMADLVDGWENAWRDADPADFGT